jgi:hypothetical protein
VPQVIGASGGLPPNTAARAAAGGIRSIPLGRVEDTQCLVDAEDGGEAQQDVEIEGALAVLMRGLVGLLWVGPKGWPEHQAALLLRRTQWGGRHGQPLTGCGP